MIALCIALILLLLLLLLLLSSVTIDLFISNLDFSNYEQSDTVTYRDLHFLLS